MTFRMGPGGTYLRAVLFESPVRWPPKPGEDVMKKKVSPKRTVRTKGFRVSARNRIHKPKRGKGSYRRRTGSLIRRLLDE